MKIKVVKKGSVVRPNNAVCPWFVEMPSEPRA
jgi:hypothetical protein